MNTKELIKIAEETIKEFGGKQEDYSVTDWNMEVVICKAENFISKPVKNINNLKLTINEMSQLNTIFSDYKLNI